MSWDFLVTVGMVSFWSAGSLLRLGAYVAGCLDHYAGFPVWLTIPLPPFWESSFHDFLAPRPAAPRVLIFSIGYVGFAPLMIERIIEATGVFGGTEGLTGIKPFPNQWVDMYVVIIVLVIALFGFRRNLSPRIIGLC